MRNCLRCGKVCEESLFCASCQKSLLFCSDEEDEDLFNGRALSPDSYRSVVRASPIGEGIQTVPLYSLPCVDRSASHLCVDALSMSRPSVRFALPDERQQRRWYVPVISRFRLPGSRSAQPGKRAIPLRLCIVLLIVLILISLIFAWFNTSASAFPGKIAVTPAGHSSGKKVIVHQSNSMLQPPGSSATGNEVSPHTGTGSRTQNVISTVSSSTTTPSSAVSTLAVFPARLSFSMVQGETATPPQLITLTNSGGNTLFWSASVDAPWLQLMNTSGSLSASQEDTISVTPVSSALDAAGSHTAHVQISVIDHVSGDMSGSPTLLPVSLLVVRPCTLQTSVPHLAFSSLLGGSKSQSLPFGAAGGCSYPVVWSVITNQPWLLVDSASGQDSGYGNVLSVSIAKGLKLPGTYEGQILFDCESGCTEANSSSPLTVSVTMTVQ